MQLDQLQLDDIPAPLRPAVEAHRNAIAARKQAVTTVEKQKQVVIPQEREKAIDKAAQARLAGKPEPKTHANVIAAEKRLDELEHELGVCQRVQQQAAQNLGAAVAEYGDQAVEAALVERETKREAFEKLRQKGAGAFQDLKRANRIAKLLGADLHGVSVIPINPSEIDGFEVVELQRHRTGTLEVELLFSKMANVGEKIEVFNKPTIWGEPIAGVPDRVAASFRQAELVARSHEGGEAAGEDLRDNPLVEKEKAEADAEYAALIEARDRELAGR